MKETFDIVRFGKYLLTDIKSLFIRRGISLVGFSLAGIAANIVVLLFNLALGDEYSAWDVTTRTVLFFCCCAFATILVPVRQYGIITDKRKGAEYLLLPASLLEKFLSLVIVSVVVIPVFFCVAYIGADGLWSLLDKTYDETLFAFLIQENNLPLIKFNFDELSFLAYDDIASFILVFVLGGLFFKKSKIGKTFLVLLGIWIVLGIAAIALLDNGSLFNIISEDQLPLVDNINDAVILLLLLAGIWFRMKKIQL